MMMCPRIQMIMCPRMWSIPVSCELNTTPLNLSFPQTDNKVLDVSLTVLSLVDAVVATYAEIKTDEQKEQKKEINEFTGLGLPQPRTWDDELNNLYSLTSLSTKDKQRLNLCMNRRTNELKQAKEDTKNSGGKNRIKLLTPQIVDIGLRYTKSLSVVFRSYCHWNHTRSTKNTSTKSTFDAISKQADVLELAGFLNFCRDFQLTLKNIQFPPNKIQQVWTRNDPNPSENLVTPIAKKLLYHDPLASIELLEKDVLPVLSADGVLPVTTEEAKFIYQKCCGAKRGYTGLKKSNFLTALAGIGRMAWTRLLPSNQNVDREYESKSALHVFRRTAARRVKPPVSCISHLFWSVWGERVLHGRGDGGGGRGGIGCSFCPTACGVAAAQRFSLTNFAAKNPAIEQRSSRAAPIVYLSPLTIVLATMHVNRPELDGGADVNADGVVPSELERAAEKVDNRMLERARDLLRLPSIVEVSVSINDVVEILGA